MKKLLAMVLTFVMLFGMTMTANAATDTESPYTADITVKGLVDGESTTVNAYRAISLNDAENEWVVASWAEDYITKDDANREYKIDDKAGLLGAVTGTPAATATVTGTSTTFEDLPVGAYVIVAAGEDTTYTCLVAETYKSDETYMTAEDVTVVAKASNYKVEKEVSDGFVKVGQVLDFTVTTTFPNFEEKNQNSSYKLTDTPTELVIDLTSVKVFVGDMENALTEGYTAEISQVDGTLTVDLSGTIGDSNANAGKKVKVTYQAEVTGTTDDDKAFTNTVVATRNGEMLGGDSSEGYTGDIVITKTDDKDENATVLKGAKFNVYKDYDFAEGAANTALTFTYLRDDEGDNGEVITVYELDADGTVTDIEATEGYVKVIGLDEGTYWFDEIKAPAGYSINEEGVTVTITAPVDNENTANVDESAMHVHETGSLKDTKLINLPTTGGIGTTIFTIAGCGIMVAAAFLFFVSRRKETK